MDENYFGLDELLEDYNKDSIYIEKNEIQIYNLSDLLKEHRLPLEFGLEISDSNSNIFRLNLETDELNNIEKQIEELDMLISQYKELEIESNDLFKSQKQSETLIDKIKEIGLKKIITTSILIAGTTISLVSLPVGFLAQSGVLLSSKVAIGGGLSVLGYFYFKKEKEKI